MDQRACDARTFLEDYTSTENRGLTPWVVSILLLSLTAFVVRAAGSKPQDKWQPVFASFPDRIGTWEKVRDITYEPGVMKMLGTSDIVSKTYRAPDGRMLDLLIIHAVDRRDAFHPPEYCLTGGGSEIVGRCIKTVGSGGETVAFNEMLFKTRTASRLLVWNTYAAGKEITGSFYRQQLQLFTGQLFARHSSGAAINLYVRVPDDALDKSQQTAEDFARDLLPTLRQYL